MTPVLMAYNCWNTSLTVSMTTVAIVAFIERVSLLRAPISLNWSNGCSLYKKQNNYGITCLTKTS